MTGSTDLRCGDAVTYTGNPDDQAVIINDEQRHQGWVTIEFDGNDMRVGVRLCHLQPAPAWDPEGYDHDND